MPEIVMLRCDAPNAARDEFGDRLTLQLEGEPPVEVIVCPRHRKQASIDEVMGWGRPARARRRRVQGHRRDTAETSLEAIIE